MSQWISGKQCKSLNRNLAELLLQLVLHTPFLDDGFQMGFLTASPNFGGNCPVYLLSKTTFANHSEIIRKRPAWSGNAIQVYRRKNRIKESVLLEMELNIFAFSFCIIFSTCRRILLAGASQRFWALPGVWCGFDSLSLSTRLLRLWRVELPQLRHRGAGGPLCVSHSTLPLTYQEILCCCGWEKKTLNLEWIITIGI